MKMKKHILLLALIFCVHGLLTGCASKPAAPTDDSDLEQSESADQELSTSSSTIPAPKSIGVQDIQKPVIQTTGMDQKLQAAIKAQDDSQIHNFAGEILAVNPRDVKALNALAMSEYRKGRYSSAESLLNRALKEGSFQAEIYNNLGLLALAKKEQREALQYFKKGLQVSPQDPTLGANIGAIYVKAKDYTKAEVALENAVKNGTKDTKILNNYAIALVANKKIDEAEKIYEKAIKENPSERDIMLNYSILLIDKKGKYKQGMDLLNRLKFVGVPEESRNVIKDLENKAKAGLK